MEKESTRKLSVAEGIKQGLLQCLAYERGDKSAAREVVVKYMPVQKYSAAEIKAVREKARLTQFLFANALGVSVRTVEAWESGVNTPSGPASRLLDLIDAEPSIVHRFSMVTAVN